MRVAVGITSPDKLSRTEAALFLATSDAESFSNIEKTAHCCFFGESIPIVPLSTPQGLFFDQVEYQCVLNMCLDAASTPELPVYRVTNSLQFATMCGISFKKPRTSRVVLDNCSLQPSEEQVDRARWVWSPILFPHLVYKPAEPVVKFGRVRL